MAQIHDVKITVLRRMPPEDVLKERPVTPVEPLGPCEYFQDGQTFLVEGGRMPADFPCGSAWNSLYGTIRSLAFGATIPWYKEGNMSVNCCIDGLRPVIFKLERI